MKYSVYQIQISDSTINQVNSGSTNNPEYTAYLDAMFGKPAAGIALNLYTKVAEITADDLEGVFEIGNIGPEENINRIGRMRSVSVGDIIEDETGKRSVVAGIGFKELESLV